MMQKLESRTASLKLIKIGHVDMMNVFVLGKIVITAFSLTLDSLESWLGSKNFGVLSATYFLLFVYKNSFKRSQK